MWLPFESKPGFGLHDGQQVSTMQVAVELCLLFSRQSSSLRPLRQLQHSLPVAFAEIDRQQELSGLKVRLPLDFGSASLIHAATEASDELCSIRLKQMILLGLSRGSI